MKFLGYELTGHLVAASSPATESLSNVKACAANGAAAIILKSASSTRLHDEKTRRCYIDEHGFWAESGFDREIMPLEQALLLTKQSVEQCNIPIIPSVTELTLEPDKWLEDCQTLEKAGASAIQLDFFYFHNLLCDNSFNSKFISLLKEIKRNTMIPIMPKISISIPAELASYLLVSAGIEYVSLLDSIHVPKPYNSYLLGEPFVIRIIYVSDHKTIYICICQNRHKNMRRRRCNISNTCSRSYFIRCISCSNRNGSAVEWLFKI